MPATERRPTGALQLTSGRESQLAHRPSTRVVLLFGLLATMLLAAGIQAAHTAATMIGEHDRIIDLIAARQAIGDALGALHATEASLDGFLATQRADELHQHAAIEERFARRITQLEARTPAARSLLAALGDRQRSLRGLFEAARTGSPLNVTSESNQRKADADIHALAAEWTGKLDTEVAAAQAGLRATAKATQRMITTATVVYAGVLLLAMLMILYDHRRRLASEARLHSWLADVGKSLEGSLRLSETLRQFSDLGSMLQGCRSVEAAITGMQDALAQMLPECSGAIQLLTPSHNLVETVATWGNPSRSTESLFAPEDCWALRRGETYPPPGTGESPRCRHVDAGHDGSYLCVPLIAHGETLGTLSLYGADVSSPASRSIAETAGEQMSLALSNLRLQETLRRQSLRDPLTGLFNRRYLEAAFERELQRAQRYALSLSVLMLDIDHFKSFNDRHGHDAGDALLAQFGALLARLVRSEDTICRYGGEEFTVLLYDCGPEQAIRHANRMRSAVREMSVLHREQSIGPITVSIGSATFPQHGDSAIELLRRADAALYAAKNSGRDRFCAAV